MPWREGTTTRSRGRPPRPCCWRRRCENPRRCASARTSIAYEFPAIAPEPSGSASASCTTCDEPPGIAPERRGMGQPEVCREHRLRPTQMGVGGHQASARPVRPDRRARRSGARAPDRRPGAVVAGRGADRATPARCATGRCGGACRPPRSARRARRSTQACTSSSSPATTAGSRRTSPSRSPSAASIACCSDA